MSYLPPDSPIGTTSNAISITPTTDGPKQNNDISSIINNSSLIRSLIRNNFNVNYSTANAETVNSNPVVDKNSISFDDAYLNKNESIAEGVHFKVVNTGLQVHQDNTIFGLNGENIFGFGMNANNSGGDDEKRPNLSVTQDTSVNLCSDGNVMIGPKSDPVSRPSESAVDAVESSTSETDFSNIQSDSGGDVAKISARRILGNQVVKRKIMSGVTEEERMLDNEDIVKYEEEFLQQTFPTGSNLIRSTGNPCKSATIANLI